MANQTALLTYVGPHAAVELLVGDEWYEIERDETVELPQELAEELVERADWVAVDPDDHVEDAEDAEDAEEIE